MRKRSICLVLVLILVFSMVPAVSAAEHGMTDIDGHWAKQDIIWCMDQGLFRGTSATTFDPDGTLTRGMFVTVLGRFAGIDPYDFEDWYLPDLYKDVKASEYYAPYVNWATRYGITNGTGAETFGPEQPVTREQMATFLMRFANCYGYVFDPILDQVPGGFSDEASISRYASEAVSIMRESGIIRGRLNSDGTYRFDPMDLAARSECAAVFHRLSQSITNDPDCVFEEPEEITLFDYDGRDLKPGDTFRLEYMTIPEKPSIDKILWISSDPDVLSVSADGVVTCNGSGVAEIYAYTCNGRYDCITVTVDYYIGYDGESYESKCMHVFGEVVKNHRRPYGDDAPKSRYLENMVTVTVKVWDYKKGVDSEKVTKYRSFDIHKNLEATVVRCFEEIYECDAQYPINSIISYWSNGGNSEHNPGTAIDINYKSNPYVDPNGKVITGEKFDPENDPYSIPVDGEIQQIFEKYGFSRGIYWRSGYKDYMHFSFFGT